MKAVLIIFVGLLLTACASTPTSCLQREAVDAMAPLASEPSTRVNTPISVPAVIAGTDATESCR